ncbi:hypothetical protein B0O99DRAFT_629109 [Bisporella sp. PMI_857]|nr:hypothetical protein B0O99DRAFT_629109 [Bisporella sp. PMI_857]
MQPKVIFATLFVAFTAIAYAAPAHNAHVRDIAANLNDILERTNEVGPIIGHPVCPCGKYKCSGTRIVSSPPLTRASMWVTILTLVQSRSSVMATTTAYLSPIVVIHVIQSMTFHIVKVLLYNTRMS